MSEDYCECECTTNIDDICCHCEKPIGPTRTTKITNCKEKHEK